jgi:hypothetical protein
MSRTLLIDTSVFQKIATGDLEALKEENERFRKAIVENDAAAKLDNQPPADLPVPPLPG